MNPVKERSKEPSTYAGLGMMIAALVAPFFPEHQDRIMQAGLALGGLLSVILGERKT